MTVSHLVNVPLLPADRAVLEKVCEFLKATPEHAMVLGLHALAGGITGQSKKAQKLGDKVRKALKKTGSKPKAKPKALPEPRL